MYDDDCALCSYRARWVVVEAVVLASVGTSTTVSAPTLSSMS